MKTREVQKEGNVFYVLEHQAKKVLFRVKTNKIKIFSHDKLSVFDIFLNKYEQDLMTNLFTRLNASENPSSLASDNRGLPTFLKKYKHLLLQEDLAHFLFLSF